MGDSFRYYLPAYIVASLVDPDTADIAVDFSAWMFLGVPPELRPNSELFATFSLEQQQAILDWLTWYANTQAVDENEAESYLQQVRALKFAKKQF